MLALADKDTVDWGCPVNWGHQLNRGLVSWWMAVPGGRTGFGSNRWVDLCKRNHGTLTNGPTWNGSLGRRGGYGAVKSATGSSQYVLAPELQLIFDGDWVISFWLYQITSNTTYPFGQRNGTNTDTSVWSAGTQFIFSALRGGVEKGNRWNSVMVAAKWQHWILAQPGAPNNNAVLYLDGVLQAGTGSSNTPALGDTSGLRIGTTTDTNYAGTIVDSFRVSSGGSQFTANHAKRLFEQECSGYPSLLNRIPIRIPSQQAGGGVTVDSLTGSFTLSGKTATLKYGRRIATSTGAYVESGKAAALKRGRRIAASTGTFAETGNTARLLYGRRLPCGTGNYSESGKPANLYRGKRLAAATGSYAVSGNVATLRAARRLSGSAGAFAVSGQIARLLFGHRIRSNAGGYSLSGVAAALRAGRRIASTRGTYLVSGRNATFSVVSTNRIGIVRLTNESFTIPRLINETLTTPQLVGESFTQPSMIDETFNN